MLAHLPEQLSDRYPIEISAIVKANRIGVKIFPNEYGGWKAISFWGHSFVGCDRTDNAECLIGLHRKNKGLTGRTKPPGKIFSP